MRHLNENQTFQYNGSPVTFQNGDSVMVNATEMAEPFGKRCNDFLSTKQTKELISSLSAKTGISATGLVDKAFKKILFSFGSMESLRNFVPFTDDDCIRYVKQAVKLPISYMGFFYALIGYWRLPLRKIIVFALVANAPSVNSVKCNRFLFDKVATYNFL